MRPMGPGFADEARIVIVQVLSFQRDVAAEGALVMRRPKHQLPACCRFVETGPKILPDSPRGLAR